MLNKFKDKVAAKPFAAATVDAAGSSISSAAAPSAQASSASLPKSIDKDRFLKEAEEKKGKGNTAMSAKNYELAVQCYSEAIDLCSQGQNSHIYFCNRAAAYSSLGKYSEAVQDSQMSLSLLISCWDWT